MLAGFSGSVGNQQQNSMKSVIPKCNNVNKPAAQAADADPSPLKLHQEAKSTH